MVNGKVETITPAIATDWLAKSRGNRTLYNAVIDRYVRAITEDRWMVNGEAIKFDIAGRLNDGHHRLTAVIKAGKSVQSFVIRDIAIDAFDSLDTGKVRRAADVLSGAGRENARALAATLQFLWNLDHGKLTYPLQASPQEIRQTLNAHPQAESSTSRCLRAYPIMSTPILGFVHCLAVEAGQEEKADKFVAAIIEGIGLERQNPARLLREQCLQSKGRGRGKISRTELVALTIKAYSYFAAGLPLKILRWASTEPFPKLGIVNRELARKGKRWGDFGAVVVANGIVG